MFHVHAVLYAHMHMQAANMKHVKRTSKAVFPAGGKDCQDRT